MAPVPPQPIPKSIASPALLAHVATQKFVDGMPLYRQEVALKRIGVELPRSTLASWMVKVGRLAQPLINLIHDEILATGFVPNADRDTLPSAEGAGAKGDEPLVSLGPAGGGPGSASRRLSLRPLARGRGGGATSRRLPGLSANGRLLRVRRSWIEGGHHPRWMLCSRTKEVPRGSEGPGRRQEEGEAGEEFEGQAGIRVVPSSLSHRARSSGPDPRGTLPGAVGANEAGPGRDVEVARGLPRHGPAEERDREGHDLPPQPVAEAPARPRGRTPLAGYQRCREFHPTLRRRQEGLALRGHRGRRRGQREPLQPGRDGQANGIEPFAYLRFVLERIPAAERLKDFEALLPYHLDRSLLASA